MTVTDPQLRELAQAYGIAFAYEDNDGVARDVSTDTVIAVLAAFDVDARTGEQIDAALQRRRDADRRRPLPHCTVTRHGDSTLVTAHVPAGSAVSMRAVLESGDPVPLREASRDTPAHEIDSAPVGAESIGAAFGTASFGTASFEIPSSLPSGYHRLELVTDAATHTAELIVVPRFLGMPRKLVDARIWGYAVQLYSVPSADSWGIGDLVDLGELAAWSVGQGAQYVLTNPLHAPAPTVPVTSSPYSPTSRRFINPIYLRPEAITEHGSLPRDARARVQELRRTLLDQVRTSEEIDRDAIWKAKIAALQEIYDAGRSVLRNAELEAFAETNDPMLRDFARWCVTAELHGTDESHWPQEGREDSEIARIAATYAERLGFYRWLQWVAHEQLAAAQSRATESGMQVGIVNDLAVGVDVRSAEVWADLDHYASGVSIGAPPDAYNSLGQGWGLAAWRPDRLAESGYRPFRDLVRSIMRSCGGIRVDHIMGLFRLWWIPQGHGPRNGTYVHYDHDAMVGILMLEASRTDALVVGEDLGTVEPWVRDYLAERGVLGTSVAWFERDSDGDPLPPQQYREMCMASVTTHDLAPTEGYLHGAHLLVRDRLGLLTQPLNDEQADLDADLDRWRLLLRAAGYLHTGEGVDATEAEILALHRYLRASPARVLCAALTDAVGDRRMQNQPGTVDEYPNWRVPLTDADGTPIRVEDLRASDRANRLAAVLNGR